MADLYARVRFVVDVPFSVDLIDLEDDGANASQVSDSRIAAAQHAETALVEKVKAVLAKHGEVLETLVEEVHE